jgi:hypothetical protein
MVERKDSPGGQNARWDLADEPAVLRGFPERCFGLVSLRNSGKEPITVQRLPAEFPAQAAEGVRLAALAAKELSTFVRLAPQETRSVLASVALDPATPPGLYKGRLQTGADTSRAVLVQVLEQGSVEVLPDAVTWTGVPGEALSVNLLLRNLGNLPNPVPKSAAFQLAPDRGLPHHFHAAAREAGKQGYQAFLNSFVAKLSDDEPPALAARVKKGAGPLAPQQSVEVRLELTVPKTLKPGRSYRGVIALGRAKVRIQLNLAAPKGGASDPTGNEA